MRRIHGEIVAAIDRRDDRRIVATAGYRSRLKMQRKQDEDVCDLSNSAWRRPLALFHVVILHV